MDSDVRLPQPIKRDVDVCHGQWGKWERAFNADSINNDVVAQDYD